MQACQPASGDQSGLLRADMLQGNNIPRLPIFDIVICIQVGETIKIKLVREIVKLFSKSVSKFNDKGINEKFHFFCR